MASSKSRNAETIVLGAGPAGYVCAIRLAQLGKKVLVIDKGNLGGVCLNVGCIPSKALIYAGTLYERMHHCEEMGFKVKGVEVDLAQTIKWKETVVNKLTGGVGQLLKANGCEVIQGEARFISPTVLNVKTKDESFDLTFKDCVIATGSRPTEIPGFKVDQETVLDSTGALNQKKLPKSLLCIGGGYIGLELGTFYAKMGTKVTVVEAMKGLLSGVDPDLTRVVEKGLKKRGVDVLLETRVKGWKKGAKGAEVTLEGKLGQTIGVDKILVTVGRKPNSDQIGIEKTGIRLDDHGFISIDPHLRTTIPNIYAIGDVAGQPLLAHKGSKEGLVAAAVIAGKKTSYQVAGIPAVIFTDPEIATVGLTEEQARAKGKNIKVGQFPFAANGRALSVGEPDGFVKMIGDADTGLLLGVHIVGPEASNLIAECTLALELGATVEDLALTVHAHPTLPEAVMEAAEATLGHAVHIYQRPARPRPNPQPGASPQA